MEKIKFNRKVSTENYKSYDNLGDSYCTVQQATEERRVPLQIGLK